MRISDWSSDVCSSDLVVLAALGPAWLAGGDAVSAFDAETAAVAVPVIARRGGETQQKRARVADDGLEAERLRLGQWSSEERRVGTACVRSSRSRVLPYHYKKSTYD